MTPRQGFLQNPAIRQLIDDGHLREALDVPLASPSGADGFIRERAGRASYENAGYAGLTLGDFLFDYIRIDPAVVRGVDFARSEDLDSILKFASFADRHSDLTGRSYEGFISSLHGYVAEDMVAMHLTAQGHDISFPHTANNAGWDMLVDGRPFQVKCLNDASGVFEHIEKYPDIPVIANAELADSIGTQPGVFIDPELHHEGVRQATTEALNHGEELADFEIPWISIAVSGAANLLYCLRGETDLTGFAINTATDFAGRAAAGTVTKYSAAALGSLMFGPAGAIVCGLGGAIAGATAGRPLAALVRASLLSGDAEVLRRATAAAGESALRALPDKVTAFKAKSARIAEELWRPSPGCEQLRRHLNDRMTDRLKYFDNKRAQIGDLLKNRGTLRPEEFASQMLRLIRRLAIHPSTIERALGELTEVLSAYRARLRRYKIASTTER